MELSDLVVVHIAIVDDVVGRRRQVVQAEHLLGLHLIHRQRRTEDVGTGVRDAHGLQQALHATVFAKATVQRDERDVDVLLAQHQIEIAIDVDRDRVVAAFDEC